METSEYLQRIGAALLAGFLLGLERETRGRAAGLRTNILVCMAATLAMILSDLYYVSHSDTQGWRPDPARLGAGILTGMGFIGAGVIVRQGQMVQGVTTAALMWFITVIGFCFGSGQMLLGTVGFFIAAFVLYGLRHVETFIHNEQVFVLTVVTNADAALRSTLLSDLAAQGLKPKLTELVSDKQAATCTSVFSVKFKGRNCPTPQAVIDRLTADAGVIQAALR